MHTHIIAMGMLMQRARMGRASNAQIKPPIAHTKPVIWNRVPAVRYLRASASVFTFMGMNIGISRLVWRPPPMPAAFRHFHFITSFYKLFSVRTPSFPAGIPRLSIAPGSARATMFQRPLFSNQDAIAGARNGKRASAFPGPKKIVEPRICENNRGQWRTRREHFAGIAVQFRDESHNEQ
jgi:hypothetical protein